MVLVSSLHGETLRRRLLTTLIVQGSVGLLFFIGLVILRPNDVETTIRAIGPSAPFLILVLVGFAFSLSIMKFKLTERVFVALGLTAATIMLPLLGVILTATISVLASMFSRYL